MKMTGDSPELFNLQAVRKHIWIHSWIYLESAYLHEKHEHEKPLDTNRTHKY